jgi:protoporphyrin/coproporphyrin ferrochelatase
MNEFTRVVESTLAAIAEVIPPEPATATARTGVLLVNLGSPDAADAASVRRYLKEFLSDRRVIEDDSLTWKLVFNGIVLPLRPRRKARAYAKIWNHERNESPLKTITRAQAEKLGKSLTGRPVVVDWAMRYGSPSIPAQLKALTEQNCDRILLVPLYPQYAAATTATVCDQAFRALMRMRRQPTLRVAPPYYAEPFYIDALASSLTAELSKLPFQPEVILASYHGLPKEYVRKGDPYYDQCETTTRLLREKLGFSEDKLIMTFQSRFGRARWLEPYTSEMVRILALRQIKSIAVVTPGFAADCLETLEEIAIENERIFRRRGGQNFAAIPCLNDSELGMRVIGALVARELRGWG